MRVSAQAGKLRCSAGTVCGDCGCGAPDGRHTGRRLEDGGKIDARMESRRAGWGGHGRGPGAVGRGGQAAEFARLVGNMGRAHRGHAGHAGCAHSAPVRAGVLRGSRRGGGRRVAIRQRGDGAGGAVRGRGRGQRQPDGRGGGRKGVRRGYGHGAGRGAPGHDRFETGEGHGEFHARPRHAARGGRTRRGERRGPGGKDERTRLQDDRHRRDGHWQHHGGHGGFLRAAGPRAPRIGGARRGTVGRGASAQDFRHRARAGVQPARCQRSHGRAF